MKCKTEALQKLQLFYIYSNSAQTTMDFITDSGENAEKKTSQDVILGSSATPQPNQN